MLNKIVLIGLLGCFLCSSSLAATLVVSNLSDSGPGTLRQAISDAIGEDTITIDITGTITLASPLPTIEKTLTIIGPGSDQLTIDGASAVRPFSIGLGANNTLLQGFTIANGTADNGGGLYVEYTNITLRDVTLLNNSATHRGGGIYSHNTNLMIDSCTFTGNASDITGGAIRFGDTSLELTIMDSTFTANQVTSTTSSGLGGAIFTSARLFTVVRCTFSENTSGFMGGAIYDAASNSSTYPGEVNISYSSFENNTALNSGGALVVQSVGSIETSLFTGNIAGDNGGAIYADDTSVGDLDDLVAIENCTFSGNSAADNGGALLVRHYDKDFSISHSTIVENEAGTDNSGIGGGLAVEQGVVHIINTIFDNNLDKESEVSVDNDCTLLNQAGTKVVTSHGYNSVNAPDNCVFSTTQDITGSAPSYYPLASNGGPTQTHSLGKNQGGTGICTNVSGQRVSTDQRGMLRPDDGCARGAFEPEGYFLLDIHRDKIVNLKDCIAALMVVAGQTPSSDSRAALAPDHTVGLDEAIAILQLISEEE